MLLGFNLKRGEASQRSGSRGHLGQRGGRLAEARGKPGSGSRSGSAEERQEAAGKPETVEKREWEVEQEVIQPSTLYVLHPRHPGVVALVVLLTKIARRKIGVFHRPTRNLVEYMFSLHLFPPFDSDSDFRFPRITAELARGAFQVCAGGREAFQSLQGMLAWGRALFSWT